jgi:hypothetical protein
VELGIRVLSVPPEKKDGNTAHYAPRWAETLLDLSLPYAWEHLRRVFMEQLLADKETQDAVVAAKRIGGEKAVLAMVFERLRQRASKDVPRPRCSKGKVTARCGGEAPKHGGWVSEDAR